MDPKLLAVRKRLRDDFPFYAKNCLEIRTIDGVIQPFYPLKPAQDRLLSAIQAQEAEQGYVRILILKARQQGLSTLVGGWMYSKVSQRRGAKAMVLAHRRDSTDALFGMVRRYHDSLPEPMKPSTRYLGKREIHFDKLDSAYIVATAGGEGVGRGETLQFVHGSEVALWQRSNAEELWAGLRQCVADVPGTAIFLESTAQGCSGVFYNMCQAALKGELPGWKIVFCPWFIEPRYSLDELPLGWKRNPDEEALVQKHGVSDNQLAWRRAKIAETSPEAFCQDYPSTPEEAFIASGLPVFNPQQLLNMLNTSVAEVDIQRYDIEGGEWKPMARGRLKVYAKPDPKREYAIGADVGKGVRGGDFSVAQVLDDKRNLVASWRGHVVSGEFGHIVAKLGRFYNNARVCVEANDHGILTNHILQKEEHYPNLYIAVQYDKLTDKNTETVGMVLNAKTRPMILDELRAVVRDGKINIPDRDTLKEMLTFIIDENNKMTAESGSHDDCVMSLAHANHCHGGIWKPIVNQESWYEHGY